ncbi:hypothetical protein LshimejAT787_1801820 [Lyophyllum shimeji]|uniref:Uncharacterized protein n=1 Tax=Lyophyllum shimeji TaxID=47721 RepID=A0A9P3UUK5_LYOSH|nr:hypothetical protein LshimejAT787_1801820 [Lyophyllum shimeji]
MSIQAVLEGFEDAKPVLGYGYGRGYGNTYPYPYQGDPWLSAYRKDERRTTQTCATCSTSRTHAKNPPHIRFITIAESPSFTWATPDDPKGRTADEVTAEENAIRTPSATRSTRVPVQRTRPIPDPVQDTCRTDFWGGTIQSADKSTGAPAPRVELPVPRKRKAAPEDEPAPAQNKRSSRSGSKKAGTMLQELDLSVATSIGPVTGTNTGADADGHDIHCSGCRNGGHVVMCYLCKRVICSRCVPFLDTVEQDDEFTCPSCHLSPPDAKQRTIAPYYGFASAKKANKPILLTGGPTTRESFAQCSSPALVVISIRLASVNAIGDSARVVFHNIAPFLPHKVAFVDLPWDFGDPRAEEAYDTNLQDLVQRLKTGDLKSFRTFSIFLTDHSDPERGDLHISSNEQGAARVSAVLDRLFPPELTQFFGREGRSTLTMLVCGAVVTVNESYTDLKAFANKGYFAWIMAFGQANLQPCLTNPLLQAASLSWFINNRRWDALLDDFQSVGAHTDIFMLRKDEPTIRRSEFYFSAYASNLNLNLSAEAPALCNVSLFLPAAKTTFVVGASGFGKSS